MAHKQPMAQVILENSNKKNITVDLKNKLKQENGKKYVENVINVLFQYPSNIPEKEVIDWCDVLIAGGNNFEEFSQTVKNYDDSPTCGLVWTSNFVAYRCRTCGISPCMSLCADCFNAADHSGHDYNMFRSQAGGACDCGDLTVMNEKGFCPRHGPNRPLKKQEIPSELLLMPDIVLPKLLKSIILRIRRISRSLDDDYDSMDEYSHNFNQLIELLQKLLDTGTVLRSLISKIIINKELYKEVCEMSFEDEPSRTQDQSYQHYYTAKKSLICLKMPIEFDRVSNLEDKLDHKCILDELMFWIVKHDFPQNLVTLLLSILPDKEYKNAFLRAFVMHYSRTAAILGHPKQKKHIANRVVHISVQILSPEELAMKLVQEWSLLYRMTGALDSMLSRTYEPIFNDAHDLQVINCDEPVMKEHCFWPIISDFINVLSHRPAALIFMTDDILMSFWMAFVSKIQAVNINRRETKTHVELEKNTYYSAYNAELEIAASPMWCLAVQCNKKSLSSAKNVLYHTLVNLLKWLKASKVQKYSLENQVTFHLPLHRYVAVFLQTLTKIQTDESDLSSFLQKYGLTKEVIDLSILHPLNIQVCCAEIASDMWNLNGLHIKGQAMTYKQTHFCNSMADPDLYLLQLGSCCLSPDYIVKLILEKFHVLELLSIGQSTSTFLKKENYPPLMEAALTLIATILTNRVMVGLSEEEIIEKELVALLSMNNRTFSQLTELIPDKCGVSTMETPKIQKPLSDVAIFIPPKLSPFGLGGLHQGNYVPSPNTWLNLFDPLFTCHRSLTRRDYQNSLNRFSKFVERENLYSSICSPWPPYRIPSEPSQLYSNLTNLLHCKTMHGLIFVLLKQGLEGRLLDGCLSLAIHLLYLALKTKPNGLESSGISSLNSDGASQYPHDRVLFELMPSTNILENVLHKITDVQVARHHAGTEELPECSAPYSLETELNSQIYSSPFVFSSVDRTVEKDANNSISNSFKRTTSVLDVNESILSLLVKVYRKLGPSKSFNPNDYTDDTLPIGDGVFFIGRVLRELYITAEKFRIFIDEFFSTDEKQKVAIDEKRKKARERQKKIMAKMQKQQQQVQSKFDLKEPMEEMDDEDHFDNDVEKKQQCSICNTNRLPNNLDSICQVTTVSLSSVLGHRIPIGSSRKILPSGKIVNYHVPKTCREFWDERIGKLKILCDEKLLGEAVTLGWRSGVRVKTCGHCLHRSCADMYKKSLCKRDQSLGSSEFICPLCRRTVNCVLPILQITKSQYPTPDSQGQEIWADGNRELDEPERIGKSKTSQSTIQRGHTKPAPSFYQVSYQLFYPVSHNSPCHSNTEMEILSYSSKIPFPSKKKTVYDTIKNRQRIFKLHDSHIIKTIYNQLAQFMESSYKTDTLLTVTSILRHNVVADLEEREKDIKNFTDQSRNSCLLQLLDILGIILKENIPEGYTEQLWAMLTCQIEVQNSKVIQNLRQTVPMLLRDPIVVFFIILLSLTPPIDVNVYLDLVHQILKLNVVQSMASILIEMSKDERKRWNNGIQGILLTSFQECNLFASGNLSDNDLSSCIWTPGTVSTTIDNSCIEFLRVAAYLKFIIFSDLNTFKENQNEIHNLLNYLGFNNETVQDSVFIDTKPVELWCQQIRSIAKMAASKDILYILKSPPTFSSPKLIELPREFEKFFSYYYKAKCLNCQLSPKEPAVCLLCGRIVCFKGPCCKEGGVSEALKHTNDCGAGTSLFILVNSSFIFVLKVNKVASWGSVYLDEHGEEDKNLKRGKPLFLSHDRYNLLERQWATNSLENACPEWVYHSNQI